MSAYSTIYSSKSDTSDHLQEVMSQLVVKLEMLKNSLEEEHEAEIQDEEDFKKHFIFLCGMINCHGFFIFNSKEVYETLIYFKEYEESEKKTRIAAVTAFLAIDYLVFVHKGM